MDNEQNTEASRSEGREASELSGLVMPFQLTDSISFDLKQAFGFEFGIGSEKRRDFYVGTLKLWVTMRNGDKICLDIGRVDVACSDAETAKREARKKMKRINKKMLQAWIEA